MKKPLTILLALPVAACAAQSETYCHTQPNTAYADCLAQFKRREALFHNDAEACLAQAKQGIPDYMYEERHYQETNIVDPRGIMHTQNVLVEPDGGRNTALDQERRKVIRPCMQEKGWREKGIGHWALGIGDEEEIFP